MSMVWLRGEHTDANMRMTRTYKDKSGTEGQILVEALVGFALLSLSIGLGTYLVLAGTSVFSDRLHTFRAHSFAEEGIQIASSVVLESWASVSDGAHGLLRAGDTWEFLGSSDLDGNLNRRVVVTTLDAYQKEIRVFVSWDAGSDRSLQVEVPTVVTRWEEALQSGGGPGSGESSGLSGDWLHPETISQDDVNPSGRKGSDVSLFGTRAYVGTTRTGNSDTFTVFDVGSPSSPRELGGYDTGGDVTSIAVSSTYAYLASAHDDKEFLILDVSDPSSISESGSFNAPGTGDGISVFFDGRYAYLGRQAGPSEEFLVFDASNPASPAFLGGFEVGANVRDISVLGSRAYLATDVPGQELFVLDISSPPFPVFFGSFSVGDGSDRGGGRSVFAQSPTRVFLGTSRSVYAVHAATSSAVLYGSLSVNGDVNDIIVVGNFAFLATANSNAEFYVLNISNPSQLSVISAFNYPQDGMGVDYEGNYVYAAVRSNDVLRVIGPGS